MITFDRVSLSLASLVKKPGPTLLWNPGKVTFFVEKNAQTLLGHTVMPMWKTPETVVESVDDDDDDHDDDHDHVQSRRKARGEEMLVIANNSPSLE